MKNKLPTACPKPRPKRPPATRQYSSIVDHRSHAEKIAASKRLRSTTPLKKKKRSKSEKVAKLDREYGGPERIAWVAARACVACGYCGPVARENAHVRTGGTGRKADARYVVALCANRKSYMDRTFIEGCHQALHRLGRLTFQSFRNVDLESAAARTESEWQHYSGEFISVKAKNDGRGVKG